MHGSDKLYKICQITYLNNKVTSTTWTEDKFKNKLEISTLVILP